LPDRRARLSLTLCSLILAITAVLSVTGDEKQAT
jgi:hypothetical protein